MICRRLKFAFNRLVGNLTLVRGEVSLDASHSAIA